MPLWHAVRMNSSKIPPGFWKGQGDNLDRIKDFCMDMFRFQTQTESIVMFRRILLMEQFKNPAMQKVFHQFFVEMPVSGMEQIFSSLMNQGIMKSADSKTLATELYAPFHLHHLDADLFVLEPEKAYPTGAVSKYLWGGKSAVMGDTPALKKAVTDTKAYDLIIIGTPIWASTYTPPIRSFEAANNISGKKMAFVTCCAGGSSRKCINDLTKLFSENEVTATLNLIDPFSKKSPEKDASLARFAEDLKKAF